MIDMHFQNDVEGEGGVKEEEPFEVGAVMTKAE